MRASSVALVFVAHLPSGFAGGFVGGFVSALLTPFAGFPLMIVVVFLTARLLGRWLYHRDPRPTLREGGAAAGAAALLSLIGGPVGAIISLALSTVMLLSFQAERDAAAKREAGRA